MDAVRALFHIIAAVGIAVTAVHVTPALWESSILDCVIVAGALFLAAAQQLNKAFTGRWGLE